MRELSDHDLAYHLATGIGDIVRGTRAGGLLHGRSLARVANEVAQSWTDEVLAVSATRAERGADWAVEPDLDLAVQVVKA